MPLNTGPQEISVSAKPSDGIKELQQTAGICEVKLPVV